MCSQCQYTNRHMALCQIVYTAATAATVMYHEREHHKELLTEIGERGNEIQVRRAFREIVYSQVNEAAAKILDEWLVNKGKLDVDTLGEIPRLWKDEG